jgi:hypothetical protein
MKQRKIFYSNFKIFSYVPCSHYELNVWKKYPNSINLWKSNM